METLGSVMCSKNKLKRKITYEKKITIIDHCIHSNYNVVSCLCTNKQ